MTDLYYNFPGYLDIDEKANHLRERASATMRAARELHGENLHNHTDDFLVSVARLYASFAGAIDLLRKTIPYKAGDRVRLVRAPKCEGGWAYSKQFLVVGAVATIKSIELDYLMRDWSAYLEFDDESWIETWGSEKGTLHKTPPDRRHVFSFGPEWFERLPDPGGVPDPMVDQDPGDE